MSTPNKKSTYKCLLCKRDVVKETLTRCGHVFCKRCIGDAIVHGTCPQCNKKAIHKDLRRIYLVPNMAFCDVDPSFRAEIIKIREIGDGNQQEQEQE